MNKNLVTKTLCGLALLGLLHTSRAQTEVRLNDVIDLVRATYQADRQVVVGKVMQLSEKEGEAFWPVYRSYREDMDRIGDGLVKLVLEYADTYPDVPEENAKRLLKQYTTLEKALTSKRAYYLKRAGKALPAAKVLRWAQLESRMDLVLRLQLASSIPLIPTKASP